MAQKKGSESKVLTIAQKAQNIISMIDQREKQIRALLPPDINYDRMKWVVMNQMRRKPELFACKPMSIINCIMQSTQLGLELDDIRGLAYMVPYGEEATFIPGYKGLIDLAYRSDKVEDIYADIVYENEHYKLGGGTDKVLEHTPLPPSKRGERLAVYAVAVMKNGYRAFAWLWMDEVEKIKRASKAKKGPWVEWEEEMIKKSAVRRLSKTVNISSAFTKAAALDERADMGLNASELFDENEVVGHEGGKPDVDIPQPKQEPAEAEIVEPKPVTPEEEQQYTQIVDMTIAMKYDDKQIADTDAMIKEKGMAAAFEHVTGEFKKWESAQSAGTTKGTTPASGTGARSTSRQ